MKTKKSIINVIASATATIMLSNCASIFNRPEQPVGITSTPAGMTFTVTNSQGSQVGNGTTPGSITLKTSEGYMRPASYLFTFKKGNKVVGTQTLTATVSGWYYGNILIGGIIGLFAIDPNTGSMYTLADEVNYGGQAVVKTNTSGQLTILDFNQLSPEQKASAKKL